MYQRSDSITGCISPLVPSTFPGAVYVAPGRLHCKGLHFLDLTDAPLERLSQITGRLLLLSLENFAFCLEIIFEFY